MKRLSSLLAISVYAVVCVTAGEPGASDRKAPELAFTVPGQGTKLLSQYRGKVVVLEFIYTTCPHCQAATKMMNRFQQDLGPKGLQAVDVAFNPNSDLLVENFAKEFQTAFPVGFTTRDQALAFLNVSEADRFVVPQLVIIDRRGTIRYQTPATGNDEYTKVTDENTVRQRLEELLAAGGNTTERRKSGAPGAHSAAAVARNKRG